MLMKRRKLMSLAIGELAASFSFIFLYISLGLGIASLVSLVFLALILIQGSFYWFVRYILLKKKYPVNQKTITTLIFFKKLDLILCFPTLVLIITLAENHLDIWGGIGFYIFAVLEYINYYWYRLSYGKTGFNIRVLLERGFERSSIHKLIIKNSKGIR